MGGLVVGVAMAMCLFWAVGAHNRLVRLRADIVRQWASVDAVWLRLLVRLQGGLAARQSCVGEAGAQELQAVQNASDQMLEVLMLARIQPLDAEVQKQVLVQHLKLVAEIRASQQAAHAAVRPDLDIALNRIRQTLPATMIPYHVAVGAYNEALAMRPASWLAKRLNFKPVTRMDLSLANTP
jgi:LemA protein